MSGSESKSLEEIRQEIDELDVQIQALLTRRLELAEKVIDAKKAAGDPVILRPEREAEILEKVKKRNAAADYPVPEQVICHLFKEIMSVSRDLQKAHAQVPSKPKQ